MSRKRGMTAIDLLVGITAVAILLSFCILTLGGMKPDNKRQKCGSNLVGLGQAMYIYAQDMPGTFPGVGGMRQANDGAMVLFSPKTRKAKPATADAPSPTVDLWLLLRSNNVLPRQFICPATKDRPDPAQDTTAYYDFASAKNLSYAYQYQHDPDRPAIGPTSDPTLPVMADGNPYIKGRIETSPVDDRRSKYKGNSTNHSAKTQAGQNIAFVDGHVSFEESPDAGLVTNSGSEKEGRRRSWAKRDNVYAVGGKDGELDPGEAPTATKCNLLSKLDTCLVP